MELENNLGTAMLSPNGPVRAGEIGTWKIEYVCGKKSINKGGVIRMSLPRTWDQFQIDNPKGKGFTWVIFPESVKYIIKFGYSKMTAAYQYIETIVIGGKVKPGNKITFIYGDKSHGGPGSQVQAYVENEFVKYRKWWGTPTIYFHIDVDYKGSGDFTSIDSGHLWKPHVIPNNLDHIDIIAPSFVDEGEEFSIKIIGVDKFFNRVKLNKDLKIILEEKTLKILETVHKDGVYNLKIRPEKPFKVKRIEIKTDLGLSGISNPIIADRWYGEKIYWGDIHIHSNFCDGRNNPSEIYGLCRDVSRLDFASVTSHDWGPKMDDDGWEEMKKITNRFNCEGNFVTLIGYEWTNWEECGNRNVYYKGNDGPILRYSNGFKDRGHENQIIDERYNTSHKLISALKAQKNYEAIVIPHHSLATMNTEFDPDIETTIEMYSCWGSSEYKGNPRWDTEANLTGYEIRRKRAKSVRELLLFGKKFGFVGGSDNHSGLPGGSFNRSYANNLKEKGGLTAVYCDDLKRGAVFDSIKNRNCYATTGHRILLKFEIEGNRMGSIVEHSTVSNNPVSIFVEIHGTDLIETVEIIKNNMTILEKNPGCMDIKYDLLDEDGATKGDFYYMRIIQKNGEIAWASPVHIN